MTLFKQHARHEAISTLVWTLALGASGFMTTWLWDVMVKSGTLIELEKALQGAQGVLKGLVAGAGVTLGTMDGWVSTYVLGTWISLPFVIFTALFVAGMITREMDRRTLEFILSLPVSRAQVLLSRWLVLAGSLAFVHAGMFLGVISAVTAQGQDGSFGRYALALFNAFLLYLFLGTLMLLVSLFVDDYGPGTGILLGVGLGLNLFHMATGDATGFLKSLREALPFSMYEAPPIILQGEVPWGDMAMLSAGTAVLLALAIWAFQRKQVAV